jgi:hypothetical protein
VVEFTHLLIPELFLYISPMIFNYNNFSVLNNYCIHCLI